MTVTVTCPHCGALIGRRLAGNLTARQKQALDFIRGYVAMRGVTPSYTEIRHAIGLASNSGVHRIITGLEERGHIQRSPFRARGISLVIEGAAA